ncbi:DNA-processing protein DprA [uncultured Clostridium sp.]|uniref:DNA-processing protein DprA n=1 Tax=uncultured Clostridium sp. TaxID=59620 RepID=UPI0026280EA9|nr:DNA-processing protein DprA [uncultured Clostridium sp.]
MRNKYYIALQLIGISNECLIDIMKSLSDSELKELFCGNFMEIEFKYNIHITNNIKKFKDENYLNNILNKSENVLEKNKKFGIKTVIYTSKNYPEMLREIKNPPAIIYIKGRNILKGDNKSIACVGTRTPSSYGVNAINSIVTNLSKEKFTVVSGLAEGVDALSHKICLNNNGRTIAVLAHGLDIIYPKKHEGLANEILENGGTLISEYPVGTTVEKFRFVHRNRIISGLSKGILMIEAKEKSGTRHTINFAEEQNKKIFCPVFSKFNEMSGLNLELLNKNKAIPIYGNDDYLKIVYELGYIIKYDTRVKNKIKGSSINKLINQSLNNSSLDMELDKEIYIKFKEILKYNDITIKEFFNSIINKVVEENKERD